MQVIWNFGPVAQMRDATWILLFSSPMTTASNAMSLEMNGNTTSFSIARQAAVAGKIAFPIPGDEPVGGVFRITITGTGLEDWLQAATWHSGRGQVPRHIKDERSMDDDGESTTWV